MKKGLLVTTLALLAAAGGALLAIFALNKRKSAGDEDDYELRDSVYYEDDYEGEPDEDAGYSAEESVYHEDEEETEELSKLDGAYPDGDVVPPSEDDDEL